MIEKNKTILLVGGGTGGHIVPVLTIREELIKQKVGINIVTIGGNSKIDQKLYAGLDNHISLLTGKLHRTFTFENIIQLFLFCWGLIYSYLILKKIKPNLIFSKAGYVSLPFIFWSKLLKIPYFIHESDIEMGASNKLAAKSAIKIFVGFPIKNYPNFAKEKLEYVGQIFRIDPSFPKNKTFDFGFNNKKQTIFVTGGSQGSRNINKAIFQILKSVLLDYNIIHHTGNLDYEKAIEERAKLPIDQKHSYSISPLLTKTTDGIDVMRSAISHSDLVISRASATTLAEVSAMKKAIIAIPYKYAAADHQTKNAEFYRTNKAAIVISDDNLNADILKKQIINLFSRPSKMKELGRHAYALQNLDGLSKITGEIIKFLNNGKCE